MARRRKRSNKRPPNHRLAAGTAIPRQSPDGVGRSSPSKYTAPRVIWVLRAVLLPFVGPGEYQDADYLVILATRPFELMIQALVIVYHFPRKLRADGIASREPRRSS